MRFTSESPSYVPNGATHCTLAPLIATMPINFHPDHPLRYEIPNQHRRNCAICGPLLRHLSLLQLAVDRLRCRPDRHLSIYPVGTASSACRPSVAPSDRGGLGLFPDSRSASLAAVFSEHDRRPIRLCLCGRDLDSGNPTARRCVRVQHSARSQLLRASVI